MSPNLIWKPLSKKFAKWKKIIKNWKVNWNYSDIISYICGETSTEKISTHMKIRSLDISWCKTVILYMIRLRLTGSFLRILDQKRFIWLLIMRINWHSISKWAHKNQIWRWIIVIKLVEHLGEEWWWWMERLELHQEICLTKLPSNSNHLKETEVPGVQLMVSVISLEE